MQERNNSKIKQEVFRESPIFPEHQVLGIDKPTFRTGQNVEVKTKTKGIRTNVSALEVLLPFFLSKQGLIIGDMRERSGFTSDQTSTIIGTHLHRIDSLLSAIVQGNVGPDVNRAFPTHMIREERDAYEYATEGLDFKPDSGQEELASTMTTAVRKFRDYYLTRVIGETWQESFFAETKSEEVKEKEILGDKEIEREEDLLIAAWVKEVFSEEPMTWEFRRDVITQREVNIVLNLTNIGLQFTGRLDSIVRKQSSDKLVVSQIIDFKTGRGGAGDGLDGVVSARQILLMRVMAEWFTAAWFKGKKSVTAQTSAFVFGNNEGNTAAVRRLDMFAYRRFNRKTGEMTLEPAPMDLELRREVDNWLDWYSAEIHKYEREIRQLIKKKIQYDLGKLTLKEP